MLKLIKHDIKEHKYVFLGWLIFIVLFAIELITAKVLVAKNIDDFIMPLVGILTSGALMMFTFIYNIYYLYVGVFSKRAYLNLKLGISRKIIILEKIIVGFVLCVISTSLGNIFSGIMSKIFEIDSPSRISFLFNPYSTSILNDTGAFTKSFMLLMFFTLILGMLVRQVDIICSLSLGHMANGSKNIISFLIYLGINIFQTAVVTIINITVSFSTIGMSVISGANMDDPSTIGLYVLIPSIVIQLVLLIPKLLVSFWAIDKKLNI